MQGPNQIDFGKLLGFATVSDQIAEGVDFQDATMGARLGAKVGIEEGPVRLAGSLCQSGVKPTGTGD